MKTVNLVQSHMKYTLLEAESDVTSLPLRNNLFGLNNKMYGSMGSFSMTDTDKKAYSKHFTEKELEYPCLVRLVEIHVFARTFDDDYETKIMDFKALYEFLNKESENYESIRADWSSDRKDNKNVILLPLNSKVLWNACNYAYQEIEGLKMDNFMNNLSKSKDLSNFLNTF